MISMGSLAAGLLLAFFIVGVPVPFALGGASALAMLLNGSSNMVIVCQRMFQGINSFPYLALPFFILAGNLMASGGISDRMITFATTVLGRLKGGLALVAILASMFFAAICGSCAAVCAAVGAVLIPGMLNKGYDKNFAAATVASGSSIGIIIPPSVPMILFCIAASVSVGDAFMAGMIPGILFGAALMVVAYFVCGRNGYGTDGRRYSMREKARAFFDALPALMMPVIILGGIYGGIFTATEAACVAVVYGLIVGGLVYKELKLADMAKIFIESAVAAAGVLLIISCAAVFAMLLTREQIPTKITALMMSVVANKTLYLVIVNIIWIIMGMFMEISASVIILTPLLLPAALAFGINPYHFGVMMITNLAIGMVTPPFGLCLFVISDIAKVKLMPLLKNVAPYLIAMLVTLFVICAFPQLSLFLISR